MNAGDIDDLDNYSGDLEVDHISLDSSHSGNEVTMQDSKVVAVTKPEKNKKRNTTTSNTGNGLRKGKWTIEEENYTNKIISLFNRGRLSIPAGTTLRSYLSEKLNWLV